MEAVNAELFTLTYGAVVAQLVKDYEDVSQVNEQLETMGYNIGVRIVDEFFAKSRSAKCRNFRETADVIASDAFRMFLGITATVEGWDAEGSACNLKFGENPLTDFVELPGTLTGLHFGNVICGAIRGALEMVQMRVECKFVSDMLAGDPVNTIRLELKEMLEDTAGDEYKEGA